MFAPMIAIQIADFFLLRRSPEERGFNLQNSVIWLVGFVLYRLLMHVDMPLGYTLPDMLVTMALCLIWHFIAKSIHKK